MNTSDPRPRRARVIPAFDDESAIRYLDKLRARPFDRFDDVPPNLNALLAGLRECPGSIDTPADLRHYGLPDDAFADIALIEAIIRRLFIDAALRRQFRQAIADRPFHSRNGRSGR